MQTLRSNSPVVLLIKQHEVGSLNALICFLIGHYNQCLPCHWLQNSCVRVNTLMTVTHAAELHMQLRNGSASAPHFTSTCSVLLHDHCACTLCRTLLLFLHTTITCVVNIVLIPKCKPVLRYCPLCLKSHGSRQGLYGQDLPRACLRFQILLPLPANCGKFEPAVKQSSLSISKPTQPHRCC